VTFRQKQKISGVIGALGAVLLVAAVGGFVLRSMNPPSAPEPRAQIAEERSPETRSASAVSPAAVVAPMTAAPQLSTAMMATAGAASAEQDTQASHVQTTSDVVTGAIAAKKEPGGGGHYPMEVGRYWVYDYHERDSDVVTQVERSIVRQEGRDNASDLFFFADGTIAYVEEGKIYEMGSNGGVNIIPMQLAASGAPVRYRSQGLQIEKRVAEGDTAIVIGGHRFEGCLEVVTRFRPNKSDGTAVSYSSFYAPGIGLVGRQQWPADPSGSLAVTLSEYGTRQPPSTADGQP